MGIKNKIHRLHIHKKSYLSHQKHNNLKKAKLICSIVLLSSGLAANAQHPPVLRHPDSTLFLKLNEKTQEWENNRKTINTVNDDGSRSSDVYTWNATDNSWVLSSKTETISNSTGYKYTEQSWNTYLESWVLTQENEDRYDLNGNRIYKLINDKDTKYKKEWTFDDNSNVLNSLEYNWDVARMDWFEYQKDSCEYDSHGNKTYEVFYQWNMQSEQWEGTYKTTATFNEMGSILNRTLYRWEMQTNSWGVQSKSETIYDAANNIVEESSYRWDTTAAELMLRYQTQRLYEDGKQINEISIELNDETEEFDTAAVTFHFYESDGQHKIMTYKNGDSLKEIEYDLNDTTFTLQYTYNDETAEWEKFMTRKNVFDELGNCIYTFNEGINIYGEPFASFSEYTYKNGELVDTHSASWDSQCQTWHSYFENEDILDENGWLTSWVSNRWDPAICGNRGFKTEYHYNKYNLPTTVYYTWNSTAQVWEQNPSVYRTVMYVGNDVFIDGIEQTNTGIENCGNSNTLAPNPAWGQTILYIPEISKSTFISICDTKGRVVQHLTTSQPKTPLVLSGYEAGVYFVKINDGTHSSNIPLVVKHQ